MLLQNFQAPHAASDRETPASPVDLISSGWTFVAEPTLDNRWKVSGIKGAIVIAAHGARLGEAFQEVERGARERELTAN